MQKELDKITEIIERYRSSNNLTGHELVDMLRELTGYTDFLEYEKSKTQKDFQSHIFNLTNGTSFPMGKAVNSAEVAYPSLYMLRGKLRAVYANIGSMRTNIASLREELKNIN